MSVNLHKKVQFFRLLDSNSHNSWLHALHCYSAMLKSNFLKHARYYFRLIPVGIMVFWVMALCIVIGDYQS